MEADAVVRILNNCKDTEITHDDIAGLRVAIEALSRNVRVMGLQLEADL